MNIIHSNIDSRSSCKRVNFSMMKLPSRNKPLKEVLTMFLHSEVISIRECLLTVERKKISVYTLTLMMMMICSL